MKDDLKRLEMVGGWLGMYHTNTQLRDLVIEFICTLVIQHFRKDVFQAIREDLRPECREDALTGKIMLCKTSLESVILPLDGQEEGCRLQFVFANRAKIRTVEQLVDFLWDFDDGHSRAQWANRGYRGLHRRALEIVQIHCGAEAAKRVHDGIKRIFVLTNWVVPYPNETKFLRRGDSKRRLWMSICHQDWIGRPADEIIPFGELWREAQDGRRRTRHFLPDTPRPDYACRQPEYMSGRWVLYEERFPCFMTALPGESEHFGHQSGVDIGAWGERLEEQWQAADDEIYGGSGVPLQ